MQLSLVSDKKILSMSRRTDPAWFPEKFCRVLQGKYPPEKVHSIVIWTKHPAVLLQKPYRTLLPKYDQLYFILAVLLQLIIPPYASKGFEWAQTGELTGYILSNSLMMDWYKAYPFFQVVL